MIRLAQPLSVKMHTAASSKKTPVRVSLKIDSSQKFYQQTKRYILNMAGDSNSSFK